MLWSLLAGALPVLAFPRPDLGWLAWVALVPGLLLLRAAPSPRAALRRGWCFGAGYLLAALSWTAPSIGPGLLAVAAVFGAPWAAWGVAARACRGWEALLVLPAGWVVAEYLRSWHGFGGPWALYGASQWRFPEVLALASAGGVWLVSFALVLVNTAAVLALSRFDRRVLLVPPAVALCVPLAWWAGGGGEQGREWRVALVQPGVIDGPAARFTEGERLLPPLSLAARFAAKEALAKALGAPPGMRWTDAEVCKEPSGKPTLHVRGTVADVATLLGVTSWHVSLSHDGGIATAVVIAEAP